MRLSELVAQLTPSGFAQVALVLFLMVFAAVVWSAFRKGARSRVAHWSTLPLCDDAVAHDATTSDATTSDPTPAAKRAA